VDQKGDGIFFFRLRGMGSTAGGRSGGEKSELLNPGDPVEYAFVG
jgi:hypothetical protein